MLAHVWAASVPEAPVMTPTCVDSSFLFFFFSAGTCDQTTVAGGLKHMEILLLLQTVCVAMALQEMFPPEGHAGLRPALEPLLAAGGKLPRSCDIR